MTVTADENTDVETMVSELRARCQRNGVAQPAVDLLIIQLRDVLTPLVTNGKLLAAQGSQLKVTRDICVDGCSIKLAFGSGLPRARWRKILDRFFKP